MNLNCNLICKTWI